MLQDAIDQVEARDLARRNAEARRVGPIAMATVGVEVWSRFGNDPRGGVCVDITETVDRGTGELLRVFVTLDPYSGPGRWENSLPESEVTEGSFEIPPTSRLVKLARRLSAEVSQGGNVATPRDLRYARWAHELLVVATGGGR